MIAKIFVTCLLLVPAFAFAGSSGYVQHGKTVVVYKDGKKVGDWPAAADSKSVLAAGASDARQPAAATGAPTDTLYFIEDAAGPGGKDVKCYSISNAFGFNKSEPISCVTN